MTERIVGCAPRAAYTTFPKSGFQIPVYPYVKKNARPGAPAHPPDDISKKCET